MDICLVFEIFICCADFNIKIQYKYFRKTSRLYGTSSAVMKSERRSLSHMLHKPSLYWLARAHVTNYPANIGRKTFPRPWRWLQRRQRCRRNQTPGRHWSRPPFQNGGRYPCGPGGRFRQCTAVEWTAAARDWSAVPACLIRISRQILKINDFSRRIGKQGNFR